MDHWPRTLSPHCISKPLWVWLNARMVNAHDMHVEPRSSTQNTKLMSLSPSNDRRRRHGQRMVQMIYRVIDTWSCAASGEKRVASWRCLSRSLRRHIMPVVPTGRQYIIMVECVCVCVYDFMLSHAVRDTNVRPAEPAGPAYRFGCAKCVHPGVILCMYVCMLLLLVDHHHHKAIGLAQSILVSQSKITHIVVLELIDLGWLWNKIRYAPHTIYTTQYIPITHSCQYYCIAIYHNPVLFFYWNKNDNLIPLEFVSRRVHLEPHTIYITLIVEHQYPLHCVRHFMPSYRSSVCTWCIPPSVASRTHSSRSCPGHISEDRAYLAAKWIRTDSGSARKKSGVCGRRWRFVLDVTVDSIICRYIVLTLNQPAGVAIMAYHIR